MTVEQENNEVVKSVRGGGSFSPVQVEGSDLCIVSLKVDKVEEIFWSLLVPLLPDKHTHTTLIQLSSCLQCVINTSITVIWTDTRWFSLTQLNIV